MANASFEDILPQKPRDVTLEWGILYKWGTKTEYTKLRQFLTKDGYIRIAPEVFVRVVQNRKASEKHYRRIEEYAPKTGAVRLIRLTEKQYQNIFMVTGEPDLQEKTVGVNCHVMI